jgi:hypothetical protein
MISILLTCLLPLANGRDAEVVAEVIVSPSIVFSFHPDSWYDQRDRNRRDRQRRIQSQRDADLRRQEAFDRGRWHGSQAHHEEMRRNMLESNRRREQARANREQAFRDEENRDRDERNHRKDDRNHQRDDQHHREEESQRPR